MKINNLHIIFLLFAISFSVHSQNLVSTYIWNATSSPVYSFQPEEGKCYELRITGAFANNSADQTAYFDAWYRFNNLTNAMIEARNLPWATEEPYKSASPVNVAYNQAHEYIFRFSVCPASNPKPFTLEYSDVSFADNSGSLSFEWYEVTTGCDVPPTGLTLTDTVKVCETEYLIETNKTGGTFKWSTGETTASILVSTTQTYIVTVNIGVCELVDTSHVFFVPKLLVPEISKSINPFCNGKDGEIGIVAKGGTAPFTYQLGSNLKQGVADFAGLSAGEYILTVYDANDCKNDVTVNLTTEIMNTEYTNFIQPSCNKANGAITLHAKGGTSPYEFKREGGSFKSDSVFTNLPTGNLAFISKSASGCTDTLKLLFTNQVTNIFFKAIIVPSCDSASGAIVLNPTGGATPYSYLWTTATNTTSQNQSNLVAGTYTVTITDANTCNKDTTIVILNKTKTILTIDKEDVKCIGKSTGRITTKVTNIAGGVNYLWSNGAKTALLENVPAGKYIVSVTNGDACVTTDSVELIVISNLSIAGEYPLVCDNRGLLSIDITPLGNGAPHSYEWSNVSTKEDLIVSTKEDLMNVKAANYSVTVTDVHVCKDSAVFTGNLANFQISHEVKGCTMNNQGKVIVTATSDTDSIFAFQWADGSTQNTLINQGRSTRTVTITDQHNCKKVYDIVIEDGDPCLDIPNVFTPNSDNINDTWNIRQLEDKTVEEVSVYNRWGTRVFFSERYDTPWDGKYAGVRLPIASYFYTVRFADGEEVSGVVSIKY
ncbi:MAG: gliding motility-associated C-terminal domain-containing protein [Bacteroidales bacterium]|nr:gliding motility-associated C-terminal domain-containing protein [Bacteroidales bacterium]